MASLSKKTGWRIAGAHFLREFAKFVKAHIGFLNLSEWRQADMPVSAIGRSTEDQLRIPALEGGICLLS
jgi:hypothetical protein